MAVEKKTSNLGAGTSSGNTTLWAYLAAMNPISIRIATQADAAVIADLSRRTFYDTFAAFNTKEDMDKFLLQQFSREMLMAEVGAQGNTFVLALCGDEPAGYAFLREGSNPPELGNIQAIEVARIYVEQRFIGQRIGGQLMKTCIELAVAKQKRLIWLGVWEHNQQAIDFYSRWGFEKFGTHDFILGNDRQTDWLMKKRL